MCDFQRNVDLHLRPAEEGSRHPQPSRHRVVQVHSTLSDCLFSSDLREGRCVATMPMLYILKPAWQGTSVQPVLPSGPTTPAFRRRIIVVVLWADSSG